MAERNPPNWITARTDHTAYGMRRLVSALTGYQAGICHPSHLIVSQKSGTPNMSVDVAQGAAFIAGTEATYQGMYHVETEAVVNKTIAAADATNPRIDRVVARVQDAQYSGATNAWSIAVVTGTPAGSPVAPTAPANSITLALVAVAAGATSITNANITDQRSLYGPAVTAYSPTIDQGGSVSRTVTAADYVQDGRLVTASFSLSVSSTGNPGTEMSVTLPVNCLRVGVPLGSGQIVDLSTSNIYAGTWVSTGAGAAKMWVTTSASLFAVNFQLASGDLIRGELSYLSAS